MPNVGKLPTFDMSIPTPVWRFPRAGEAAAGSGGSGQVFETADVSLGFIGAPVKARRDPVELQNEARTPADAGVRASF